MTIYWVLAAIIGAAGQTARNAMQRNLTVRIGTVGATQVRFLYGFPFALILLAVASTLTQHSIPSLDPTVFGFTFFGSLAQIMATALMLLAMRERSFAVATAYTKTEPVQVAVFGVIVLGDALSLFSAISILVATTGVMLMAIKPGDRLTASGLRPAAYGIASGAFFAMSAVCFRGAIIGLGDAPFALRASTILVTSLGIQTMLLMAYMAFFDRKALTSSLKVWRASLFAGFMGAFASQAWFIGFSLTSAAHVRTLGLVEMIFAQIVTRGLLNEATTKREWAGMILILAGVGALLALG